MRFLRAIIHRVGTIHDNLKAPRSHTSATAHGEFQMEQLNTLLGHIDSFVWGWTTIALLVGTGLFLTIRLLFVQIRYLIHAVACVFGKYDQPEESGDISHFKALATALSATIGTGNIAGVATAIVLGGPGAIFWMWLTAIVGMATKFASCTLAVKYRKINDDGSASGGPK